MEKLVGALIIIIGVAGLLFLGLQLKSLLLSVGLIVLGSFLVRQSGNTIQRL